MLFRSIDSLTKHPSVIRRKISGVGWIGRGGRTAGEQPESEAVQVTLLHGFLSGHLHGSDGFVALVLVGIEIDEPAGASKRAGGIDFHGLCSEPPMHCDTQDPLLEFLDGHSAFRNIADGAAGYDVVQGIAARAVQSVHTIGVDIVPRKVTQSGRIAAIMAILLGDIVELL